MIPLLQTLAYVGLFVALNVVVWGVVLILIIAFIHGIRMQQQRQRAARVQALMDVARARQQPPKVATDMSEALASAAKAFGGFKGPSSDRS
jgi:uncharacterized membrane protein